MTNPVTPAKSYRITEIPENVTLAVSVERFADQITVDGVNFTVALGPDGRKMVGYGANNFYGGKCEPVGTRSKLALLTRLGFKVEEA